MTRILKYTSSLRIRFALGFSVLVTVFVAFALFFIYASFANFRKEEFYKRLKDKSLTTFRFLVEVEQIDNDLLQLIDKNTLNSLYDEKVMIYKDTTLIYSSIDDRGIYNLPELFRESKENEEYRTTQGVNEVIALSVVQSSGDYTILASAFDRYGRSKMKFLKWLMIVVYIIGMIIGWIIIFFFVKRTIRPLEQLKNKLKNINYTNLDVRLPTTKQGDEVNALSTNFNEMLSRLQESFGFQQDFVHYASHELRTPLAAMVGLTESSMNKKLSEEEAKAILFELFQQQSNLTNITNSLLVLSDNYKSFHSLKYPKIRLDEMVFRSVEIIKNIYPKAIIEVNLEGELTNETSMLINANEPLIVMALNNLLKNALQYSPDNTVRLVIKNSAAGKKVAFFNKGNPLPGDEGERIFTPFFRASNTNTVKGYGLGLPLVKQIILLHNATITYHYENNCNEFRILFPPENLQTI